MYTTSTDFKTVINNPSRKFECKVVCGSKTYTNVNIANINITGSLQPSGYTIGSAISQKAVLKFINDGKVTFPANVIELQIGLMVNNSYEYIPIGKYVIDSHDSDDYTITITAYDNMTKLEQKYNGSAISLRALAQEVCSACGVTLADSGSIPTTTITAPTSGKYTCRELMGYIAGCCCGNAVIDRTGALKVQKLNLSTINKQVTTDNWFTYKNQDMIFQIEQLICDTGSNEKLTSGSTTDTDKQLTIKNPLMTQSILDSVKTELSGVIFTGFDIKYQGDISTDLGDTVEITDRKGQVLTAPLLNRTINYNGGLTENIKTEGKKKVDVASSYYGSGRYALELDKFNFNMKDLNTKVNELDTKVSNLGSVDPSYNVYIISILSSITVKNYSTTDTTDWGDGTIDKLGVHTYASAGQYKIISKKIIYTNVITEVLQLSNTITNMNKLFNGYTKLTKCCDIPEGVTDTGYMFYNCYNLKNTPKLSSTVQDASYMFYGCKALTAMAEIIQAAVLTNASYMFYNCTGLVDVKPLPDKLTDCSYMFQNCTGLITPPALGDSVTNAWGMFKGCTKLTQTPVFTDKLTDCSYMFDGCTSLISANDLSSTIQWANYMFSTCKALVNAPKLNDGLLYASDMFYCCLKLKSIINLPNSIQAAPEMFRDCQSLEYVNSELKLPSNLLYASGMFKGCLLLSIKIIFNNVLKEATEMFLGCKGKLSFSELPDTLTTVDTMFYECTNADFTGITKLPAVTNYQSMFLGCKKLQKAIPIPDGALNVIGMYRRSGITQATKIPNTVTDCTYVYAECISLTTVDLDLLPNNPNIITKAQYAFYKSTSIINSPTIWGNITDVYNMFCGCTSLTEMAIIEEGVKNISYLYCGTAISDCNQHQLPDSIEWAGGMFWQSKVTSTLNYVPTGITSCGDIFRRCSELKSVTPAFCTFMAQTIAGNTKCTYYKYAFAGSDNITNPDTVVNLNGQYPGWGFNQTG